MSISNMDASCTRILVLIFVHLCCLTLLKSIGIESSKCIPSERDALLRIKHHLIDPSNRLFSWNASNPNCCHWPGVVCSNVTSHVLQLHLSTPLPTIDDHVIFDEHVPGGSNEAYEAHDRLMFAGEISHSLVDLKHLEYLDLSGNDFGGVQIPSFLCEITSLTYLNLSGVEFYGKIPPQIGNLSNLMYLDLTFAAIGIIPYQIGNLTNLVHLNLHSYGGDPLVAENLHWLLSLRSLQYLDLTYADLSKSFDWLHIMQALPSLAELHLVGCTLNHYEHPSTLNFSSLYSLSIPVAPKWIFQLKKLINLQLGPNYSSRINGPIPDGIQNLTLLERLDLSQNSFSSSIPGWLYGLHHLKFLNLDGNLLNGAISNAVRNLTSLVSLDLSYNQLEGVIPISLGSLSSLVILDLSGNKLEGAIPTSLGKLCNLREIYLSNLKCNQQVSEIIKILTPCVSHGLERLIIMNSQISGHLTGQFEMFKNLITLDFSHNSIIGTLPLSLGKLSSLSVLDLSNNQLNENPFKILGSIPKLSYLDIGDNLFQGVVQRDDLANFATLMELYASGNNLTLKVDPNWQPSFQLINLEMTSWQLGPNFPSWIRSQKNLGGLEMSNAGISDSIPTWFWKTCPRVWSLNLSRNHIYGELPNTLRNLDSMSLVDLSSNHLHGKLPHLPFGMQWLDVSNNSFSGSISNFLCQESDYPSYLEFLNLASNNLSGEIPDCWKMWPSLVDVNLQSNYFIGNLPSSMGYLTELQSLQVRNNMLSGEFPLILNNTSKMVSLDLGENNLEGFIPEWVGERLANLKILRLRSNKFSGNIPNGICDMKLLQDLDTAQNHLSGSIPKCFNRLSAMVINKSSADPFITEKNMTSISTIGVLVWVNGRGIEYRNILGLVKSIDLSNNKLSGEIPRELTHLSGLIFLNLSKNQLSGRIPQSFGNMESLESIDFSRNQLSGEIPPTLTNLSFLSKMDVSYNHLKGRIPTGTQLQSFDASDFVGNDLCGPPLLVNCSSPGEIPNNDKDNDGHGVNWLFVSMALGFIVGFWGVVGSLVIYKSWRYAYFRFFDDMWYKLQSYWW